jgi:C1A family cysteine protease
MNANSLKTGFTVKLNKLAILLNKELKLIFSLIDISQANKGQVGQQAQQSQQPQQPKQAQTQQTAQKQSFFQRRDSVLGNVVDTTRELVGKVVDALKPFDPVDLIPTYNPKRRINWVKRGLVAPIQDQLTCGCCWAFAAAGMVESRYAIHNKTPFKIFSRQQLIDCVNEKTGYMGGCDGGHPMFAAAYMSKFMMVEEPTWGYNDLRSEKCPDLKNPISEQPPIGNFQISAELSPEEMYELLKEGPVAINIDAMPKAFMFYSGGILTYQCQSGKANHAVLLVGYGYDEEVKKEFWTIKNSWGPEWGENGYVRLLKSDNYNSCFMYQNVVHVDCRPPPPPDPQEQAQADAQALAQE